MADLCPCCGQALPSDDELRIDDAGIIVRSGRFTLLTVQENAIFASLHAAKGRLRTKEQLLSDGYWQADEEPEIKIIDVWVCKLRKKLRPLGVNIETVWGRGYRLVMAAARKEAA
jgi:DNA-binding response OmpR family regulator